MLQIEAMAQLGGLVMLDPSNQEAKEQFFFGGIEGCRFRRPVVPGDCLVSVGHAASSCNHPTARPGPATHTTRQPAACCSPPCTVLPPPPS